MRAYLCILTVRHAAHYGARTDESFYCDLGTPLTWAQSIRPAVEQDQIRKDGNRIAEWLGRARRDSSLFAHI